MDNRSRYPVINGFHGFDFVDGDYRLPYRLLTPGGVVPATGFPLLVYFHGMGSIGNDNQKNLMLAGRFGDPGFQQRHPCYVLAAQCPEDQRWVTAEWNAARHVFHRTPTVYMALFIKLLEELLGALPVDRARLYVGGGSMGGFATWDILCRQPRRFAAAFPICGGCDVANAPALSHVPLWVFHGALDRSVLPSSSREMVAALRAAGGAPRYTEYPDVAHDAWNPALAEPELFDWLFAQRRSAVAERL
ncbi:MAG: prolyl oligopeptidase family serine peptidase [Lentisphaeria bacterium]